MQCVRRNVSDDALPLRLPTLQRSRENAPRPAEGFAMTRAWEPIETAPRYGVKFRALLDDGKEMEGISWWPFDGWHSSGGHRVNPTHWERPEPEPEGDTAESLLRELVEVDWCIGYELTEDMQVRIDDIRTRAALLFDPPKVTAKP